MEKKLSQRILALSPSATFAMAQKSAELSASGVDVVNMSVGEPDSGTPAHIAAAAKEAIDSGFTKYSPVPGFMGLREAVCGKLRRDNGLEYSPSEVIISSGAKQSICNAVLSLVDPGDEVIIPAPFWVSYPQMVLLAGGVPVHPGAGIDSGFKISPAQLEDAITPRTRLVILCSPANPSGAVYSRGELLAFSEVLLRHPGVFVLADQIYESINYTGAPCCSIASLPGMRERSIVVGGVSKSFAMTGWRIGWMAAPKWLADACNMLQGQYTSCPSSVSQKAAEAALRGGSECVEEMCRSFRRRRDLVVSLISAIPGVRVSEPQGAFYLLPDCSEYIGKSFEGQVIRDATDLAMYLLQEGHVATVAGDPFGAPGCIRISYAVSDALIREGAGRIEQALKKLV